MNIMMYTKNGLQQLGKYQTSNVVKDVHKGFAVKKLLEIYVRH